MRIHSPATNIPQEVWDRAFPKHAGTDPPAPERDRIAPDFTQQRWRVCHTIEGLGATVAVLGRGPEDVDFYVVSDTVIRASDLPALAKFIARAPERIRELEEVRKHAEAVMTSLQTYGSALLPHLLDNDDNDGERLRQALRAAAPPLEIEALMDVLRELGPKTKP